MSNAQVCYYRASVQPKRSALAIAGVREALCVAHFYVQTDDVSTCGAVGAQFCMSRDLQHLEFLSLPQGITPAQIAPHDAEHLRAYELALSDGVAVVISVVGVVAA